MGLRTTGNGGQGRLDSRLDVSKAIEGMYTMHLSLLGQVTGSRIVDDNIDLNPLDTSEAKDAMRTAEMVCQLARQQIPQAIEMVEGLLIYPEGEDDAVTITERDLEGLEPRRFLSNNIVDFYIKYLERSLSPDYGKHLYFFNSVFFTKLLESTASTCIDPCKVDYVKVQNWAMGVDLFDKKYIFIPILQSSHWSLIIICNLNSLTRELDVAVRLPCMLHLDPLEGKHESFEGWMKSYILQAWMGRSEVSRTNNQLLALCQMQYLKVKVPQQDNSHDCGLYVLSYIEAFLVECTPPTFNVASQEWDWHITRPHFVSEVSTKRGHIKGLILELSRRSRERAQKCRALKDLVEEVTQASQKLQAFLANEGDPDTCIQDMQSDNPPAVFNVQDSEIQHGEAPEDAQHLQPRFEHEPSDGLEIGVAEHQTFSGDPSGSEDAEPGNSLCKELSAAVMGKHKRGRKMTEEETWVLLSCKLEGGRFCKGSRGATHWNLISEEIESNLGTCPSADQCRLRFDTLKKAYESCKKYCLRTGKTFSEIPEKERLELKLATSLSEKWYLTIDEICDKAKSPKRIKPTPGVCEDLDPLSARASPPPDPPPIPVRSSLEGGVGPLEGEVLLGSDTDPMWFPGSTEDLQNTLLNLVQECSEPGWQFMNREVVDGNFFKLKVVCRRLAILQDREPGEIFKYVWELWRFGFVMVLGLHDDVEIFLDQRNDLACIDLWKDNLWVLKTGVYERISKQVLCGNPLLKTHYYEFSMDHSSCQYIQVLRLLECQELYHLNLDLQKLPNLRTLAIQGCPIFNSVTGWECATRLGSLAIAQTDLDFPHVQSLVSLREFEIINYTDTFSCIPWQVSQFNLCVKLQKVKICKDKRLSGSVGFETLKELKCLEDLSINECPISSIQGLSALQGLTKLSFRNLNDLQTLPGLGCLTRLTHLKLLNCGVEDIGGVEELESLTKLHLHGCKSLTRVPFLGHLKELVSLNVLKSGVKVIPGIEALTKLRSFNYCPCKDVGILGWAGL